MDQMLPNSIVITIALLTFFLIFITALKFAIDDTFTRTRAIMTSFFFFIIATLTVSFWRFTLPTLPFTIPAFIAGAVVGYFLGVRAAEERLSAQGLSRYMEHFAHIHITDLRHLTWWSIINFYSVMGALLLINFVGLSTVIFKEAENWAIVTSVIGAFLLGTIAPYLVHLWSLSAAGGHQENKRVRISTAHTPSSRISEKRKILRARRFSSSFFGAFTKSGMPAALYSLKRYRAMARKCGICHKKRMRKSPSA